MSNDVKNSEVTYSNEKEVTEKSFFETYLPAWFMKMNIKSKLISLLVIILVLGAGAYAAYYYAKLFILNHIPEIVGITIFAILGYLIPKTDAWKNFIHWLLVKHKNWKILGIMVILSTAVFLVNFQSLLHLAVPFMDERVIDNFVVVTYVYLMVWLYMKWFSEHKVMKYVKHIIVIAALVLFRALFQHPVSALVEQLLNVAVLAIMFVMMGTYIYETLFVKDKQEKKRITFVLQILLFATLVFSPYFTSMLIAKKRIDTINFVEIQKLPPTKYDVPVDEKLANIWIDQDNAQNEAATVPDPILYNGSFAFMADTYSVNFWDHKVPFLQKPTNSVKILTTDGWNMKIKPIENHAIYSEGLMYGHNSHAAVAKRFDPLEYFTDTTENTIKFRDINGSFYTVELVSTLSDYLTPYSVPKNIYVIKDSDKGYDFLFGAGAKVELKDAANQYKFLKGQQIVPLNVIWEVAKSSQLLTGWGNKLTNRNLMIPDEDKFQNVIIERLYTSINGKEGIYAHIQLIAKETGSGRIVSGKKQKKRQKGKVVLQSWFIPLFYTGDNELTVYYFDNKAHGYTYPAMSRMDSSILGGVFSTGYEVFGKTSVIRDGNYYVLASRVKVNDGVYSMTPNFVLYSVKTNRQYEVHNPEEMEKVIKEELAK